MIFNIVVISLNFDLEDDVFIDFVINVSVGWERMENDFKIGGV